MAESSDKGLDSLQVWNRALKLVVIITKQVLPMLPDEEKWSLAIQLRRSSQSIPANIAEGYGRYTPAERKRFYHYSRGFFEEAKAWLRKLIRRKIITGKTIQQYTVIIDELGPKLNAFIRSTKINED